MSKTNTNKATTSKRADSEKPWFRKVKDTWFVWKDGRQVSLGVKGEENRKEAFEAFYRLMANGTLPKTKGTIEKTSAKVHTSFSLKKVGDEEMMMTDEEMELLAKKLHELNKPKVKTTTIQELFDGFLKDKQGEISQEAWRGYAKFLKPFALKFGTKQAETLTTEDAEDYTKKTEWSSTYRADFLGTLISVFRWGVKKKYITSSPVEGVKKPQKQSRGTKSLVSEDEHKKLLDHADDDFRDFLVMLWNTGARPSEIAHLTAEQIHQFEDGFIPLENHKTSHKGKARFLILRGEALEVATKRANKVKTGLLFTGQNGQLTPKAISAKMERLCNKAKMRRVIAYGYRHTFATTALVKGLPDAQVAALLGHADTSMLHKHYSHLTSQSQAMKEAMAKVRP